MNILQVISRLDQSDASEDVVLSTRSFTLNGHKVIVVSPKSDLIKKMDEVGARHISAPFNYGILSAPALILKLIQIIIKENIDIIHARDPLSSFAVFFASRFTAKSFVSTFYSRGKKGILGRSCFWAKGIICLSEEDAFVVSRNGASLHNKVIVIPPPIEITSEKVSRPEKLKDYYIVMAKLSLISHEDTEDFVKIISILSRAICRLKVFVVCEKLSEELEAVKSFNLLIRRHALSDIVKLIPKKYDDKEIPTPDLFIEMEKDSTSPSRLLLKFQAKGIPIITTNDNVFKGYDGAGDVLFFPNIRDTRKTAAGIIDLYKNPASREEFKKKSIDFIKKNFKIDKVMDSTLEFYRKIILRKNILIIKTGALGDSILITPSILAIRDKFTNATIKVLVGIKNREVFSNLSAIDDVIVCDFDYRDRGIRGLLRIGKKLRSENFDMVIDFQNNKKSHILSYLSCAPERYGYDNGKLSFLINRKIKDTKVPIPPVEHQEKVLMLLGIKNKGKMLELDPGEENIKWAQNFLNSHWVKANTKLIAVNIEASKRWLTKLWPIEYFASLCNRLAQDLNARILLIGSEKDSSRMEEFLELTKCKLINASGKTNILQLAALIKRSNLLITSDSAPVHFAAAVKTPFVALFGPTDPKRHAPPSKNNIIINKELPCSPCYHTHCDRNYRCMSSITTEEVYEAATRLLKPESVKVK